MSGRRGRGRGSERRPPTEDELMYGAISHFAPMGYPEADIRSTVEQLIQVYGEAGMGLLQEDHYLAVQDALFEKQEEQEKQPQQLLLEQGGPNMQKEAAIPEAPVEREMTMAEVQNEILAIEGGDPMLVDRPAPKATLPRPAATETSRARRPCYGWISESESDSDYEEYLASRQKQLSIDEMR
ncbi:unnamed protein product [Alopecurus aequalis]